MHAKVVDMFCFLFLFVSITVSQANSDTIQSSIYKYYKSDGVMKLRKDWELYRKPIEHSIAMALKETMGCQGMNVYIRKMAEPLAMGYYHDDHQIRLILRELSLKEIPRFWMPEVQFSLASNVFKLQTTLSKMIIDAEYALMRNKSRVLYETREQNPSKSSPFLFQQVQDVGRVALSMDGCVLSGFVIITFSGDSINLGYGHYKLIKCIYTVEIYRPGEDSPPVVAKYWPQRDDDWSLDIRDLLIKPIREELDGKLQAAMLSFVNVTSLFGNKLQGYIHEQRKIFAETATFLTDVHRNLNKITIEKNNGQIMLDNHYVFWDNDQKSNYIPNAGEGIGESLNLTEMVLTGLDTMYSAHSGGPYKMNTVMIAEEMRYSTLQVNGYFVLKRGQTSNRFAFASEIKDLTVDLQMDVRLDKSIDKESILKGCSYRILQVTGFRQMILTFPAYVHGSVESMIYGHLLNELPRVIRNHLKAILREALRPTTTTTPPAPEHEVNQSGERSAVECSEGNDDNVNRRAGHSAPVKKYTSKEPEESDATDTPTGFENSSN